MRKLILVLMSIFAFSSFAAEITKPLQPGGSYEYERANGDTVRVTCEMGKLCFRIDDGEYNGDKTYRFMVIENGNTRMREIFGEFRANWAWSGENCPQQNPFVGL